MTTRARILMLEPSRYRALLLNRTLSARIPEAIIVRFVAAEPALEELDRGRYAGAIINIVALTPAQIGRLSAELREQPVAGPILLISPETPRRSLALLADIFDSVLMNVSTDPEVIAEQLALRLVYLPPELPGKPVQSTPNLSLSVLFGE